VTLASCSCTRSNFYWSSSTDRDSPHTAWGAYFYYSGVFSLFKDESYNLRAVRGGL